MTGELKTIVRYRLSRAHETLDDARILWENRKGFSAVNRIYYAMFYVVSALLLTRSLSAVKHTGVLSLFNREFIQSGQVEKEWGRFYTVMFEFRQKADYKDLVEFSSEEVKNWLDQAGGFVDRIDRLIQQTLEPEK